MEKRKYLLKIFKYSFYLLFKANGLRFIPYIITSILAISFPLFTSFIMKCLIDALESNTEGLGEILFYAGVFFIATILLVVIDKIRSSLEETIIEKTQFLYDSIILEKVTEMPLEVFDSSEGKDMIEDAMFTNNVVACFFVRIVTILTGFYAFFVAFSIVYKFNHIFSIAFLILTVPGIIINEYWARKLEDFRLKKAPDVRKFSYYRWMLTDAWPAKDVRMYDLTEPIKKRYSEEKIKYFTENKKLGLYRLFYNIVAEIIRRAGEIIFTAYVIIQTLNGEIQLGNATMYIGFALSAAHSFDNMVNMGVFTYFRSIEGMERTTEFFSLSKVDDIWGKRRVDYFESLCFDNVFFKYPGSDEYVLNGVSFTIKKGEKLVIIGVNGAGKTTLIKLMLGMYQVEAGTILLNGYPITDYLVSEVRKLFSVLFQDFVKYPLTLRDNIALSDASKRGDDEEVIRALKQSGFYEEISEKTNLNLDSIMTRNFDDNGVELSKGQWQKIALARLYFKECDVYVLDEPSSALDAEAEDRIFTDFSNLSNGKTGIMISHRISVSHLVDRIVVLDGGQVSEIGTHDMLMKNNGLYSRMYNMQKEKYKVVTELT